MVLLPLPLPRALHTYSLVLRPPQMPRSRTRWTGVCKTALLPPLPRMSNYSPHLCGMQFCWSELDETSEHSNVQKLRQAKAEEAWLSPVARHQLSEEPYTEASSRFSGWGRSFSVFRLRYKHTELIHLPWQVNRFVLSSNHKFFSSPEQKWRDDPGQHSYITHQNPSQIHRKNATEHSYRPNPACIHHKCFYFPCPSKNVNCPKAEYQLITKDLGGIGAPCQLLRGHLHITNCPHTHALPQAEPCTLHLGSSLF